MSLKGKPSPLEYSVIAVNVVLFALVAWNSFQGAAGASYTAHLRAVMICLTLVSLQLLAAWAGLVAIATTQHRELKRTARMAAMVASRRASDADDSKIADAASDLRAVAERFGLMMHDRSDTAEALKEIVERLGVDVVKPVPPPGGRP